MILLTPHSPNSSGLNLQGLFEWRLNELKLVFQVFDPQNVLMDSLKPAHGTTSHFVRAEELWKTTCFEAFWAEPGKSSYWEFNVSANSPKWNLYHFFDYRSPQPPRASQDFQLHSLSVLKDRLECRLTSNLEIKGGFEGSLCVIARTQNETFYYASKHAGEKPDFHRRDSFTL